MYRHTKIPKVRTGTYHRHVRTDTGGMYLYVPVCSAIIQVYMITDGCFMFNSNQYITPQWQPHSLRPARAGSSMTQLGCSNGEWRLTKMLSILAVGGHSFTSWSWIFRRLPRSDWVRTLLFRIWVQDLGLQVRG